MSSFPMCSSILATKFIFFGPQKWNKVHMIWHLKSLLSSYLSSIQHQMILRGKIASWRFFVTHIRAQSHTLKIVFRKFCYPVLVCIFVQFPFGEINFRFTSLLSFRAQLRQSLEDFCTLKNWQIWDTNRDASECRFAVALRQRYVETALSYCDWWCHEPGNRGWPATKERSFWNGESWWNKRF